MKSTTNEKHKTITYTSRIIKNAQKSAMIYPSWLLESNKSQPMHQTFTTFQHNFDKIQAHHE